MWKRTAMLICFAVLTVILIVVSTHSSNTKGPQHLTVAIEGNRATAYICKNNSRSIVYTTGLFDFDNYWMPAENLSLVNSLAEMRTHYALFQMEVPLRVQDAFDADWTVYTFTALVGTPGKSLPLRWVIGFNSVDRSAIIDCVNDLDSPRKTFLKTNSRKPMGFRLFQAG